MTRAPRFAFPLAPLLTFLLASPAVAAPVLAALAPADDARAAIAVGPAGQVYRPDGKGAWVRTLPVTTAGAIARVGTAGGDVVALADGAVYRLAPNGWSALRLAQKGKAVMSGGTHVVAAVGRQLFAFERPAGGGAPVKLATAPASVLAIGAGAARVVATERGIYRYDGRRFKRLPRAPRRIDRFIDDRWALVDGALVELATGARARLPADHAVRVATVGRDGPVAVAAGPAGLVLVTVQRRKVETAPLPEALRGAVPVGVVADDAGRVLVAFEDGRLALRVRGAWTTASAREALPAPHPGPPPARTAANR